MHDVFLDEDIPLTAAPAPGAAPPADASVDFVSLRPALIRLFRSGAAGDVTVRATIVDPALGAARSWRSVRVARAFPLRDPAHYIGLRSLDDKDIGMIVAPADLDPTSRRILDEELERRYFVPVIRHVVSVKEEGSILTWDVETDRGRRLFYVQNLRDSVYEITPNRRILLTDKDGLRYEIPDVGALDAVAYAILARAL